MPKTSPAHPATISGLLSDIVDAMGDPIDTNYAAVLEPSDPARENPHDPINSMVGKIIKISYRDGKIYTYYRNEIIEVPPYILQTKNADDYRSYLSELGKNNLTLKKSKESTSTKNTPKKETVQSRKADLAVFEKKISSHKIQSTKLKIKPKKKI